MNKTLGVHFGLLSDPLSKQLKEQGFKFNPTRVKLFEAEIDAINRLKIAGHLVDSSAEKVRQKIYKAIEKHVMQQNKLAKAKLEKAEEK